MEGGRHMTRSEAGSWDQALHEVNVRPRRSHTHEIWSDLEALAWVATRDHGLASRVGMFAWSDDGRTEARRRQAYDYLQFQVASKHCGCRMTDEIGPDIGPCGCTRAAWWDLLRALKRGVLTASMDAGGGVQVSIEPIAFRGALRPGDGPFTLTGTDHELRFDRLEVEKEFPKVRRKVQTAKAEHDCKGWLESALKQDPEHKHTREWFLAEAEKHFEGRLSKNAFWRVWSGVAPQFGRNKPGRPKSTPHIDTPKMPA